ncbi:UDP-3-O-(3-hydroxymyristoyl)glucosamine N-acyltransferase [Leptospira wolffii]|uniref:UDP-3-O-(3-hydroxymyristoyl)glucosamine N-acyltransferase n=1 Tax=Leptospira wolffii TaxID=409998 RepID=A0A2M9Z8T2_9LEPT|nr:UDP-3-O-acyl-N-acetylglucosamine deacetylase [Leptospira wolffii]PJZ64767.1 UDP-3-O-(3-hydroxymyristoyl)glucosamine N-acyltransferase [Leptospira wolffii]
MDAQVFTESERIGDLIRTRNPEFRELPDFFIGKVEVPDQNFSYTLSSEFTVSGKATFENKDSKIRVSPALGKRSSFTFGDRRYELDPSLCHKGNHNIQLGEIKIIEHPLAWLLAFGIYADFELSESSFPTFDYCDLPYIEGMRGNLRKGSERPKISVSNPFAMVWEKGYCILEPGDSDFLVLDHQVAYPGNTIGNARIRMEFRPETFSYFADARTTAFRTKKDAEGFYQLGLAGGLKDYPFTLENVLLLDEEKIYNPRKKYFDPVTNFDYEFLCHEAIDIASWLRFVEEEYQGRFVGRMTTFLFDHHKQIDIAKFACDREKMEEAGLKILR